MKFVSKSGNLCITLKPGVEGNRLTGAPTSPGLYVRFKDGMAVINDEEVVRMMKMHPGFKTDFEEIPEEAKDPFASMRRDAEPGHTISEIKHGQTVEITGTKQKLNLSPEMTKALQEMAKGLAMEMTKELAPKLAMEMLKGLAESNKASKEVKGAKGTKQVKKEESTQVVNPPVVEDEKDGEEPVENK